MKEDKSIVVEKPELDNRDEAILIRPVELCLYQDIDASIKQQNLSIKSFFIRTGFPLESFIGKIKRVLKCRKWVYNPIVMAFLDFSKSLLILMLKSARLKFQAKGTKQVWSFRL